MGVLGHECLLTGVEKILPPEPIVSRRTVETTVRHRPRVGTGRKSKGDHGGVGGSRRIGLSDTGLTRDPEVRSEGFSLCGRG